MPTKKMSIRLDDETKKLIALMVEQDSTNATTVIKLAVREMARQRGITSQQETKKSVD